MINLFLFQISAVNPEPQSQRETFLDLLARGYDFSLGSGATILLFIVAAVAVGLMIFYYGLHKVLPIVALLFLGGGLYWTLSTVEERQIVVSEASADEEPQGVSVVSAAGTVVITWSTRVPTSGFITIGETPETTNERIVFGEYQLEPRLVHEVRVADLQAGRTYYFTVISQNREYLDKGEPWSFVAR